MKIGLQVKSILVLAVVVLATTASGGWLYFTLTRSVLIQNDRNQADRLIRGLAIAAEPCLVKQDRQALQKLVSELASLPNVRYVAVLDVEGKNLASAQKVFPGGPGGSSYNQPSLSYEIQGPECLEIGRPLLANMGGAQDVAGAVRLITDTANTRHILAGLHRGMAIVAPAILAALIPLGYLLVWRVMVVPVRKLLGVTRRLANGDFSARVKTCRNDEIGELASSFDEMAEKLYESQQLLRGAKESLERKVIERTSELELTNRRLRDEMSEKEDFLRAVSHDLGAPLRNIAGMATLISTKWRQQLPEEVLGRLQRIQANVDAETGLIRELLELSRIKTQPESRDWVDFSALLADLAGTFEFELRQKNIALDVPGPMPRLYVERNRMRQVFQNLIDNAIKYMGDRRDGQIEIGYRHSDGSHVFSVADNGPGVPPEDRERIFYVFRRVTSAATANVPGKGVGLAVVKSIVGNYDGRVWVDSGPTGGSVFYVALSDHATQGPQENQDGAHLQPVLAENPSDGKGAPA